MPKHEISSSIQFELSQNIHYRALCREQGASTPTATVGGAEAAAFSFPVTPPSDPPPPPQV